MWRPRGRRAGHLTEGKVKSISDLEIFQCLSVIAQALQQFHPISSVTSRQFVRVLALHLRYHRLRRSGQDQKHSHAVRQTFENVPSWNSRQDAFARRRQPPGRHVSLVRPGNSVARCTSAAATDDHYRAESEVVAVHEDLARFHRTPNRQASQIGGLYLHRLATGSVDLEQRSRAVRGRLKTKAAGGTSSS